MDIGKKTDNLILNTSGRVYIAVKNGKYELDFRGNKIKALEERIAALEKRLEELENIVNYGKIYSQT